MRQRNRLSGTGDRIGVEFSGAFTGHEVNFIFVKHHHFEVHRVLKFIKVLKAGKRACDGCNAIGCAHQKEILLIKVPKCEPRQRIRNQCINETVHAPIYRA